MASADSDQSVATGSAWLFWAQVAGNAGFFAAVLVLARALSPSGRGAIAFITVTALVVARVTRLGVSEATEVFVAQRPASRPALLTNLLLFSFGAALASAAVVCGVLLALDGDRPAGIGPTEVALLGLGLIASAAVDAGYTFLLGCARFREQAIVTAASSWLYAALLGIAWLAAGLTVARAATAWTIAQALRALPLLMSSARGIGFARPDLPLLRESLSFGLRAWIGTLSRFFSFRLDQVLMGFMASGAALGVYAVAVNASEVLLYVPMATTSAILPVIARTEPGLRAEQTLKAFRSLVLIVGGSVVVALVAGPPLLPVVFGPAYQASVTPFICLLPAALGYAMLGVFSRALVASGAPALSSAGALVAFVVGTALDVILIPPMDATGAAIAASAGFLAGGAVALAAYRGRTPFAWRALLVPRRGDLDILRAIVSPFGRLAAHRRAH